jgi:hypothetical protein
LRARCRAHERAGARKVIRGAARAKEHVNPRLVAGLADLAYLEPEFLLEGSQDFGRLAGLLVRPGDRDDQGPVGHRQYLS